METESKLKEGGLHGHKYAWRDLLGNANPSPKMFPVLICTHSLQTPKCLLSVNIFIRFSLLLPLIFHPGSKHSGCQETPLTQSQQGWVLEKGTSRSQQAASS